MQKININILKNTIILFQNIDKIKWY
jgi:hypothetical protein